MTRVSELTLRLLDDELTDEELTELLRLVDDDPDARAEHLALMDQEAALRGLQSGRDLAAPTLELIRDRMQTRVEEGVMAAVKREAHRAKGIDMEESTRAAEPNIGWIGGKRFWGIAAAAAALLIATTIGWTVSVQSRTAPSAEAVLYGQWELTPEGAAAYRVLVRDGRTGEPAAGATVDVALVDEDGRTVWQAEATTDADGVAPVEGELPADLPEGSYTISVDARSGLGAVGLQRSVRVDRSFRVMVSTDKPLYQPGQTIRMRSLALATADGKPAGGRSVTFEVRDAKGNKVFKKLVETSDFGIAAADFQLADQVNMGDYVVTAILDDVSQERQVTVDRYRLPKYKVELTTEKSYYAPGETMRGELSARYTFGEPVAGARVEIVAQAMIERLRTFAKIEGTTDRDGRLPFEVQLSDAFVGIPLRQGDAFCSLQATVVDGAGDEQVKTTDRTVTNRPIRIDVVPESGELVHGVENVLYVVTSYPDGRPAKTTLRFGHVDGSVETDDSGIARVAARPMAGFFDIVVHAEDAKGVRADHELRLQTGPQRSEALLLRTDRAIYRTGDTLELSVLTGTKTGRVFVDVVKAGRTQLMRGLDVVDGAATLPIDLPADLAGTLQIHAYRLLPTGEIVGDTRLIQVTTADQIRIQASLDRETYRPGEKAVLDLLVTRGPVDVPTAAALSLSGVDEAVFALQEMRPGLERVYFALQEELLTPRFEIHAHGTLSHALHQSLSGPNGPGSETGGGAEPSDSVDENLVLFAAAGEAGAPGASYGETFADRDERFREEARDQANTVVGALSVTPSVLFLLLLLPLQLYGLARLVRRDPIREGRAGDQRDELRRALGSLGRRWVAAIYVPMGVTFLAALIFRRQEVLILGTFVAANVAALLGLAHGSWRARGAPASREVPQLRRLLWLPTIAFPIGVGALFALGAAANSWPRLIDEGTAILLTIALIASAITTTGALAVANRCAIAKTSAGRWIWTGVSRIALAGLPALALLGLVAAGSRGMEKSFSRAMAPMADAGGWDADAVATGAALPMTADGPSGDAGGEAGDAAGPRVRRSFPETLLWVPQLITDENGKARLEVPLADSITTWRLGISAVSSKGELGAETLGLRVFQDFFCDLDLPVALTQNDEVTVPVALYNYLDRGQNVEIELQPADWYELIEGSPNATVQLGAREVSSASFRIVAKRPGTHALLVKARGEGLADAVERKVRVLPDGEPVVETMNGILGEGLHTDFTIPESAIEGADDLVLKIYPGSFSQVLEGLDGIFRMPSGCFEQTSSSTYPNILVLDYLRRTNQVKPDVELTALGYINTGYQRLLSFECDGGGFEWFGQSPAHTVLTAYGLLEFSDMAKVHEIDPDVIDRTREWLFSMQESDGTWEPTQGGIAEGAINAYQGQVLRTTAYVAWAMAGSGVADARLQRALDHIAAEAPNDNDPYTLALCANALVAADHGSARAVLELLDGLKVAGGENGKAVHWTSSSEGVTYSSGDTLAIEATALAAHAYLESGYATSTAHAALAWLVEKKDPHGTWGSTQATIHAMRALLRGAGPGGSVEGEVNVTVAVNGEAATEVTITAETADVYRLVSLREHVKRGENRVSLEVAGKGNLAYQLVATHYRPWPGGGQPGPDGKEISIEVTYDAAELAADDLLGCEVTVRYDRPGTANMTIVDLGIPPGFELMTDSFEKMKSQKRIEKYSVTPRQAILYLRELKSGEPMTFRYQLRAKFPLKVKTPSSSVYQYYEPDLRDEAEPTELRVY